MIGGYAIPMIYLIDGHNLIGKLADIALSDPDDEEKLIRRLQDWRRIDPRRKIDLYFDAGPAGGLGDLMGGKGIAVHFSRVGQSADDLIKRKLNQVRNPQEYSLVTSDREILAVSRRCRIGYVLSEEFAALMAEELSGRAALEEAPPADPGESEEIELPAEEVAHWLSLFDKAPRPQREVRPEPLPTPVSKPRPESLKPPTADELKNGLADLSGSELASWMALFAKQPEKPPAEPASQDRPASSAPELTAPPVSSKPPADSTPADSTDSTIDERGLLDAAEVEEWLRLFGEETADPD